MASRILLADDSITIQKVVNLTFADEGIEVVAVSSGDLAERRLGEINPDLVLADIFMPGKTGYELCEYIKQSPQFRHVPVVLLVGAFEPFDQNEARRVRADDHLTKPFESRTLVETVRKLISKSGKLSTGPLPSEPTNEEVDERPAPPLDTRPIAPPSFNIDLTAMSRELPKDEPVAPEQLFGTAPLDLDYSSFSQQNATAPLDFHIDGPSPFAEEDLNSTTGFDSPTYSAQPGDDLFRLEEPAAEPAPDHSSNSRGSFSGAPIAGDYDSSFQPGGSSIPSAFAQSDKDVLLDFERLDSPDMPVPDNIVSFDVDMGGSEPASVAEADDSLSQSVIEQPASEPVSEAALWSAGSVEFAGSDEVLPFDPQNDTAAAPSPSFDEAGTPSALFSSDDPLGDVLFDHTEQSHQQAAVEQPDARAAQFAFDEGPAFELSQPIEAGEQQRAAPPSPLDFGEETDEASISFQEEPQATDFVARPSEDSLAYGEFADWSGGKDRFDDVTAADFLAVSTDAGQGPDDSRVDQAAAPRAPAPDSSFTASEMWTEEETRFAAIDIEATPVGEQPEPEASFDWRGGAQTGFEVSPLVEDESDYAAAEPPVAKLEGMAASAAGFTTGALASGELPPAVMEEIVRRVVAEISDAVVREVAWEVVPDCVERVVERLAREALPKRV